MLERVLGLGSPQGGRWCRRLPRTLALRTGPPVPRGAAGWAGMCTRDCNMSPEPCGVHGTALSPNAGPGRQTRAWAWAWICPQQGSQQVCAKQEAGFSRSNQGTETQGKKGSKHPDSRDLSYTARKSC